ncbi:MAG TPA: ABC transporter permease [Acidimicrobiales bacterium]
MADGNVFTTTRPASLNAPSASPQRSQRALLHAAGIAAGVGLVLVGTMVASDAHGLLRTALVVGGLYALVAGVSGVLQHVTGRAFDITPWLCGAWLAVIALTAALADVLPLAEARNPARALDTPALLRPDLLSKHPLGTDRQGLDMLGELIFGARVSLVIGIGAVTFGLLVGGSAGLVAGYRRGRLDSVAGIVNDTLLSFPPLILLLALVAVLGPNVRNVTIALGILSVPTYFRLVRANSIAYANREFVMVARALGAPHRRIIFRELLPNVAPVAVSYSLLMGAVVIVAEASLSYLGLSVQRPDPTWGNLISSGEADYRHNPHLVAAPGIVLFATVYSLNRLGEAARRRWDPRTNQLAA